MEIVYICIFFTIGAILGSFYNVVGLRIPKKQSIVAPPSHCTSCQKQLPFLELIPIFSYILLRGKCRSCGSKISPIYIFSELLTGVLFVFSYWKMGINLELIVVLLFISMLIIINVSDITYMRIPDKILLFFLPLFIIGRLISPISPWWDTIIGAVIGFSILYVIAIVSKGGMGGGDIKLLFLIGLVLGTLKTLLTLFLAAVIGMLIGAIVLGISGKGGKTPLPFGPSIAIAAIIVYFYGETILTWYIQLF